LQAKTILHMRQKAGMFEVVVKTYKESRLVSERKCSDIRDVEVKAHARIPSGLDPRWITIVLDGEPKVECSPPRLLVEVRSPGSSGSEGGAE